MAERSSAVATVLARQIFNVQATIDGKPNKKQDDARRVNIMTSGSFPADPGRRRVILVLREHDIERCGYEPEAAQALLDDEIFVLKAPLEAARGAAPALKNIEAAGLARPGSILVQSPYDSNIYEDVESAPQRFALAKHMHFSNLCRHLGAKEVRVEQIDVKSSDRKSWINVKAKTRGSTAQGSIEAEELEEFRSQMSLVDRFEGAGTDIESAEKLLQRTGLLSDQYMRDLLEMRRDGSNHLLSRTLKLNLSSESSRNLSAVGRLTVPTFIDVSAEYKRIVQERHEYIATVFVSF